MTRFIGYQIGFYAVWGACIFGALRGAWWAGPGAAALFIAVHLQLSALPSRQVALVLFAGVFGVLADLVLIHVGDVRYFGLPSTAHFGPAWIVALWMAFAPAVNVSFAWLRGRGVAAALIGSVGGFVAYEGGRRLGVVSYEPFETHTALALIVVWGVAIPLFVQVAHWCEEDGPSSERELGVDAGAPG